MQANSQYNITEIDTGSLEIENAALNDQGALIAQGWRGYSLVNFIWDKENGLQIIDNPKIYEVTHFNNSGAITGIARIEEKNDVYYFPFLMNKDKFELIKLPIKKEEVFPVALNNQNQILFRTDESKHFLWENQKITQITLPKEIRRYEPVAMTMNDKGEILFMDFDKPLSFVWKDGKIVKSLPQSLGYSNIGLKLNNLGDVAGTKFVERDYDEDDELIVPEIGMIWTYDGQEFEITAGENTDVNIDDINDKREVVGRLEKISFDDEDTYNTVFYWSKDSGIIDLNDLIDSSCGCKLADAIGINNAGQILLKAYKDNDEELLILLTPSS
jgi:hypothetical protein